MSSPPRYTTTVPREDALEVRPDTCTLRTCFLARVYLFNVPFWDETYCKIKLAPTCAFCCETNFTLRFGPFGVLVLRDEVPREECSRSEKLAPFCYLRLFQRWSKSKIQTWLEKSKRSVTFLWLLKHSCQITSARSREQVKAWVNVYSWISATLTYSSCCQSLILTDRSILVFLFIFAPLAHKFWALREQCVRINICTLRTCLLAHVYRCIKCAILNWFERTYTRVLA